MSTPDWLVLLITLAAVIGYGIYKSTHQRDLDGYIRSNSSHGWFLILLSIMGTQASAITFLSAPGQAFTDGMRFVQYYFGLPVAMVVICVTFVPLFHKLKIYTAYEFLEQRFDVRTRTFTAVLFLVSRGLSTGISIYAPSIILSSLLGWNIYLTNLFMGGLLIIYTLSGGAKAVAYTQMQQLFIVFAGMFLAGWMIVKALPDSIGFTDALTLSGKLGKMNIIETRFDPGHATWWKDKYNIWSGLIGGFFLALSYFGTDQSQVGRYLTAKDENESKMGLLLNGLVKVPMQFFILLIGVLLFSFYVFFQSPVFFNEAQWKRAEARNPAIAVQAQTFDSLSRLSRNYASTLVANGFQDPHSEHQLRVVEKAKDQLRVETKALIKQNDPLADVNDTNYIFLYYVVHQLPVGLVGLLIAVIFLAAWGSISAALHSLGSSTVIDIYRRLVKPEASAVHYYKATRWFVFGWGVFCMATAMFASQLGSLIEAVNVLGSLFYGTMLGIFLVAFYLKRIGAQAVFYAAVISEVLVILIFFLDVVSFLWLNAIGCLLVLGIAWLIQQTRGPRVAAAN